MISRRNALRIVGALVVCAGGKQARAEEDPLKDWVWKPTSYTFDEAGIESIRIIRKDKTILTIPFSEIVEALAEERGQKR